MSVMLWIAVPMMLLGAAMLLADIGAAALWIAVISLGIVIVALNLKRPGRTAHR